MNWTGGRLQRHSKANTNAQVKAQRDYFARARLRQNTRSSIPTSIHFPIAAAPNHHEQSRRSLDLQQRDGAIEESRSKKGRKRSKAEDAAHNAPTPNGRAKIQSSNDTTSSQLNTLEHVKRTLLKKSDWLGLAGTRPPKPDQTSGTILEQVGRRRRVTREDRERQEHGAGQRKIEHTFIKPFAEADGASAFRPTASANLSIRIGSNIHQSQTTKSERPHDTPASAVPESSSTEPMLLDIVEAQQFPAMLGKGEYYLAGSKADDPTNGLMHDQDRQEQGDLVSLEEVRGFPSFDDIKRYSSSARHVTTPSSRSASNQLLRGAIGSQTRPLQHTSSSFVQGTHLDDRGLFSSGSNEQRLTDINSEAPVFTKFAEDVMMQDIAADIAMMDTSSTGQEARELPPLGIVNIASQNSLSAFEKSDCRGPSLAKVGIEARSNYDSRDAAHGELISSGYPRPRYTLEQQVQLEEGRNQQSNHLALPVNSGNNVSIKDKGRDYRRQRGAGGIPTNEKPCLPIMRSTPEANAGSIQIGHGRSPDPKLSSDGNSHRTQSDENEAWMRDVFSTDFEKLQQRFAFAQVPTRRSIHQTPLPHMTSGERHTRIAERPNYLESRRQSSQHSSESSLGRTIKTGANTVLNMSDELDHGRQRNVFISSETDFLSPMTGYLDDRTVNLSPYINAANTVSEFMGPRQVAAKRTASEAFGNSSYDQYNTRSQSEREATQTSSPAPYRVPLHTLYQAPVRTCPIDQSQAIQEDSEHVLTPTWRLAKPPLTFSNNRTDRSLASREQLEYPSRTYNQHARFSLDYTPMRSSTGQLVRNCTQVEASRHTSHAVTSQFDSRFVSPTQPSRHRVPVPSDLATKGTNTSHYKQHHLNNLATKRHPTPSARFATSTSSQSTGLAPASSSSGILRRTTNGPVNNLHTNQPQHFVFKAPHRPAAQYAHPSRVGSQSRAPPSAPLAPPMHH